MRLHPAARVALLYLVIALPWVLLTDAALRAIAPSREFEDAVASVKGAGFVFATTVTLYLSLRRVFDRQLSARRQAEAGEARFRGLIESVGDVVFTTDREGRYTGLYGPRVRPEHQAYFVGRLPTEIFGADVGHSHLRLIERVVAGESVLSEWSMEEEPPNEVLGSDVTALRLAMSPLREADGSIVGVVGTGRDVSHIWALEKEQQAQRQRLDWLAHHDELTELPNRALMRDRMEQAMLAADRDGHRVAVHFIDADAFKDVNDAYGHAAGDELIRAMGERFRRVVRSADTVARMGGDEFVIVQGRVDSPVQAARLADRVIESFGRPFTVMGQELFLTVSLGVALYPEDGRTTGELMQAADTALYAAKQAGRERFEFFAPGMAAEARHRLDGMTALRRAVRNGEITVAFQPILRVEDGHVEAVEALARWVDPERGAVSPAEFIPMAEAGGFVHEIGAEVRRQAFDWLSIWRRAGLDVRLHFNVSEQVLRRPGIAERLQTEAGVRGLPLDGLVVEVTESAFIGETAGVLDQMERLRASGFRLAIDDYGTGYASVGYLRRLPFSIVKLAREFVDGALESERDREIVRSTIALGRFLGLEVIAEGVEHEPEAALLRALGADCFQGFLYARPMPGEEVEAWCTARNLLAGSPLA
ncbi:MAG: hypothetical protein AMXMBFR23_12060 [Chloroflexota bacterium]